MRHEDLIELLEERPFVPLRLHLSNGRTHDIRHPEMAIAGRDVVALGIENDEDDAPRIRGDADDAEASTKVESPVCGLTNKTS